ncbi:hypothetical protein [Glaciimonas immobilis]|uniref:Uncharacterized protein n=1 Tax=Glaciimonas immobilis TaxID=728004 RepID=A0A840RTH6_9BURK|nr:hypothetical protein [Glaciimonas immobilis]KAF3997129.1 hypothetical protein HAV38_15825 [Glaciimonas immobilis]MBB5199994.1 hypothetical protein [Glaciimonas immobilis]
MLISPAKRALVILIGLMTRNIYFSDGYHVLPLSVGFRYIISLLSVL